MEVRATAGDNRLGGEGVDELMVRRFAQHAGMSEEQLHQPEVGARLRRAAEATKRRLAVQEAAVMRIDVDGESLAMTWTLRDLEAVLEPLLERMRQPVERALRDSRIRPQELDAVVLAGGSTRLLAVRQLVTRLFGRFPEVSLDPDEVVALGAAVQAALRGRDKALAERVMTDVCPYTLGIHVSREMGNGHRQTGFMAPVLERNTIVPASRVKRFYPVSADQTQIAIEIYQGEARRVGMAPDSNRHARLNGACGRGQAGGIGSQGAWSSAGDSRPDRGGCDFCVPHHCGSHERKAGRAGEAGMRQRLCGSSIEWLA